MAMQGSSIDTRSAPAYARGEFVRTNDSFYLDGINVPYDTIVFIEGPAEQDGDLRFAYESGGQVVRASTHPRLFRRLEHWRHTDETANGPVRRLKRLLARERFAQNQGFAHFSQTVQAGSQLELAFAYYGDTANGSTIPGQSVPAGMKVEVKAVSTNKVRVRTDSGYTIWVYYEDLQPVGYEASGTAPKPFDRKLPPEDLEDAILPSDPRIAWLFERIGEYAQQAGYCAQFDTITELFGIPGRKREFRVTFKLGPAEFAGKIEARSQAEADEIFKRETLAAFKEAMAE